MVVAVMGLVLLALGMLLLFPAVKAKVGLAPRTVLGPVPRGRGEFASLAQAHENLRLLRAAEDAYRAAHGSFCPYLILRGSGSWDGTLRERFNIRGNFSCRKSEYLVEINLENGGKKLWIKARDLSAKLPTLFGLPDGSVREATISSEEERVMETIRGQLRWTPAQD